MLALHSDRPLYTCLTVVYIIYSVEKVAICTNLSAIVFLGPGFQFRMTYRCN